MTDLRDQNSDMIVVLPLGAHEQHGPHLPFETDTIIVEGIVARVSDALPADLNVNFLPAQPVGYSIEHMDTKGTQSLAFAEAVNQWIAIGENLHAGGIRKLVMLNAHGGNSPLMTIVATELRTRLDMLAVATSWTRFGLPEGLITPEEKALDIHGGFIETSVMLALRPDLVDMAKARDFPNAQSRFAEEFKYLRAYGPHAFGWKMHDLNPDGVAGNAIAATAQAGEKLLAHAVSGFIDLLRDVDRFELTRFNPKVMA
ncbi:MULTISPECIES: creatininase family protein [unclassified Brucella]|uniref:creatininase family protein n=1 Tax=unclassified Brucella TaxID=2632610 RepID=UPI00217E7EED|nr:MULTISPECIES: creatininase family protein [unclassified Brucella]UWF67657.1 creatininase family protein [Brucella sp. 1315]UWF70778.1 creatininase family protein [Brucella sp. 2594]